MSHRTLEQLAPVAPFLGWGALGVGVIVGGVAGAIIAMRATRPKERV